MKQYIVEKLVADKTEDGQTLYLAKWQGFYHDSPENWLDENRNNVCIRGLFL